MVFPPKISDVKQHLLRKFLTTNWSQCHCPLADLWSLIRTILRNFKRLACYWFQLTTVSCNKYICSGFSSRFSLYSSQRSKFKFPYYIVWRIFPIVLSQYTRLMQKFHVKMRRGRMEKLGLWGEVSRFKVHVTGRTCWGPQHEHNLPWHARITQQPTTVLQHHRHIDSSFPLI